MKSASVEERFVSFECTNVLGHYSPHIKNAEGKRLVFSAGSTEGLGTHVHRPNPKNFA